jgi:hypothetical protein
METPFKSEVYILTSQSPLNEVPLVVLAFRELNLLLSGFVLLMLAFD